MIRRIRRRTRTDAGWAPTPPAEHQTPAPYRWGWASSYGMLWVGVALAVPAALLVTLLAIGAARLASG